MVTLPASGPTQVKLKACVSIVPPPAATGNATPAICHADRSRPICQVPPSSVTCPGRSPDPLDRQRCNGNPSLATIFQVPSLMISRPIQDLFAPPDVAAAKNVPEPSFVKSPGP